MSGDNQIHVEKNFYFDYDSPEDFIEQSLQHFNFEDYSIIRPGWDKYFMDLCFRVAQRTNCMKRAVGCVLVKDKRIVSTGYNGTVIGMKNCNDGGCERCNSITAG